MKEYDVVEAAREAVKQYRAWHEADGAFPEPEYDDFMNAMDRLADVLGDVPVVAIRGIITI